MSAPTRARTARVTNAAARLQIAFVGTFPPTQCGLATFTESLVRSMGQIHPRVDPLVVRLVRSDDPTRGCGTAAVDWITDDPASLGLVLDTVEGCDAVVLQHEYGIYGGRDGEGILDLLRAVTTTPRIAVLHTVLAEPTPHQRAVLEEVVALADVTVTQSEAARSRLCRRYRVADPDRIVRVPHGTWTRPGAVGYGAVHRHRDHPMVMSWGLLGPGKGFEHGIAAVARLSDMQTPPEYLIAGETHPKVRAAQGERYREALRGAAMRLGVGTRVLFDDTYYDSAALAALIRVADVVLLPYDSREQVTSGVLVEALAAGKPVVATAFPHAVEVLSTGAGILVGHGDSIAMAEALRRILAEPGLSAAMAAEAARVSVGWHWSAVAQRYLEVINRLVAQRRAA